jgi:hypothetical protein
MPKYFIDVAEGTHFIEDEVGTILPDRESGRQVALQSLGDMIKEDLPTGENQTFIATVRDEQGEESYCAKITLSARSSTPLT